MSLPISQLQSGPVLRALSMVAKDANPQQLRELRALVEKQLSKHPKLRDTQIAVDPSHPSASYGSNNNTITTSTADPDVIGHELGHAENIQDAVAYKKLLLASRGLLQLSKSAVIPVMAGLRTFVPNQQKRDDILNTLAGLSASAAAPSIMEEASASLNAVLNSDNKLRTATKLAPAFAGHALSDLLPTLLLQLNRRMQ